MEFVMGGLLTAGLVLVAAWLWSLRGSLARDGAEAAAARRRAQRDGRLARVGEPLRCLGCGAAFPGPLTPAGCPDCHLSVLVVPASEAEEKEAEEK